MISTSRFLVLILASFLSSSAMAGAREDLRSFTNGLRTLEGEFSQQVFDDGGRLKETSSGHMALSSPKQFRWEYVRPYTQLIVADGSKVWIYDPDLQQVTVRSQEGDSFSTPLTALTNPDQLERQFDVSEEATPRGGLDWLTITPKVDAEASFEIAKIGFDTDGLVRMEIVDTIGQRSVIDFSQWKRNPALATDRFRFVPAPGVDVVDGQ
ncbi:MAG: outer membrane lipoprotein chaperone LolA [Xanthomonadaceae bacterium]|jgi:outer membrane lipoprotein carrier protein|nr:outer membrane lipoprotein chaperone LolA [Xanthomonadaceae bacterium]